jgi:hypothetical protein
VTTIMTKQKELSRSSRVRQGVNERHVIINGLLSLKEPVYST